MVVKVALHVTSNTEKELNAEKDFLKKLTV
jgi:hypothetical protein